MPLEQVGYEKTPQALALEAQGHEPWLKKLGPRTFTKPLAPFHNELWGWFWDVRLKILRGETVTPEELAFLAIWFRGGGKSSNVEWACIAEGGIVGEGFVMYVCDTEKQAKKHVLSIRDRLDSPEIAHYYPGLANPKFDRHGVQVGWRQDYLATASGWGIIPVGLDQGIRGGRQRDMRFTMIVLDDIDSHEDSPAAVEKKLDLISRSILPAGTSDTLVLFPQNLIHENSVLNQILTRRSDILSERKVSGPVKAFEELELELDDSDGGRKWRIRSCKPTWPGLDIEDARKYLAKFGRAAFLAEYQHDFESNKEGRVLRNYDDRLMVITKSDFEGVYGSREVPQTWAKRVFHDWARTKTAYHANVAGKLTVANQNTKLPGKLFLFDLKSFEAGTQADDVGRWLLESISPFVPGTKQTWGELIDASVSREGLEVYLKDSLSRLIEARRDVLAHVIPPKAQEAIRLNHYNSFVGSHEQANDALAVYRRVYGLPFAPINPGQTGGLEWIDHFMFADKQTPHPFFEDEKLEDGSWRLGCPGLFIVVEDDKYPYPQVATPDALHDSDLCRYQFNHWRMRAPKLTEAGMTEYGPMKMNDDYGTALQMAMVQGPPAATPLTYQEQVIEATPKHLRPEELQKKSPYEHGLLPHQEASALLARKFAEKRITPRYQEFNEFGDPM